jgi:hypothetical protein
MNDFYGKKAQKYKYKYLKLKEYSGVGGAGNTDAGNTDADNYNRRMIVCLFNKFQGQEINYPALYKPLNSPVTFMSPIGVQSTNQISQKAQLPSPSLERRVEQPIYSSQPIPDLQSRYAIQFRDRPSIVPHVSLQGTIEGTMRKSQTESPALAQVPLSPIPLAQVPLSPPSLQNTEVSPQSPTSSRPQAPPQLNEQINEQILQQNLKDEARRYIESRIQTPQVLLPKTLKNQQLPQPAPAPYKSHTEKLLEQDKIMKQQLQQAAQQLPQPAPLAYKSRTEELLEQYKIMKQQLPQPAPWITSPPRSTSLASLPEDKLFNLRSRNNYGSNGSNSSNLVL